jgi:hypothetical protein
VFLALNFCYASVLRPLRLKWDPNVRTLSTPTLQAKPRLVVFICLGCNSSVQECAIICMLLQIGGIEENIFLKRDFFSPKQFLFFKRTLNSFLNIFSY